MRSHWKKKKFLFGCAVFFVRKKKFLFGGIWLSEYDSNLRTDGMSLAALLISMHLSCGKLRREWPKMHREMLGSEWFGR